MPKNLEDIVKEFGDYLLKKGKSQNTVELYKNAIYDMLLKTGKTPNSLILSDVEKHVSWIRTNLKHSSKKTRFSAIKKYLKYLKLKYNNIIYDNYLKEIDTIDEDMFYIKEKYQPEQKDIIVPNEAERIFNVSKNNPRNFAILKLFYYSWQRSGSIQNLNYKDIDFTGEINPKNGNKYHKIHIQSAKNDQSYDIYVESDVIEAINRYIQYREKPIPNEGKTNHKGKYIEGFILDNYGRKLYHEDAIFLNGKGQRLMSRAMGNMMKRYAAEAGITKRIFPHLWRASGITLAESNGISISQIMTRSGHMNIQSLKPYLNPRKNETNMKISEALSNKDRLTETQAERNEQLVKESEKHITNRNIDERKELLKLELANKKAEIEILKLKQNEQKSENNVSMYH